MKNQVIRSRVPKKCRKIEVNQLYSRDKTINIRKGKGYSEMSKGRSEDKKKYLSWGSEREKRERERGEKRREREKSCRFLWDVKKTMIIYLTQDWMEVSQLFT